MRGSWPLILALWGAGLSAAMQYAKISVIYDLLGQIYPDSGAALGWLVSMVGGIGILLGVVAAMLVARVRYRRALLGALWLGALVSAAQALLPALPVMLGLRLIEGLSHLAIVVAAPTLIAQIATDRQRGLALTLWGTFFGVAFAIMAWGGRPLALAAGVPALFVLHGAYMAGFALYFPFCFIVVDLNISRRACGPSRRKGRWRLSLSPPFLPRTRPSTPPPVSRHRRWAGCSIRSALSLS